MALARLFSRLLHNQISATFGRIDETKVRPPSLISKTDIQSSISPKYDLTTWNTISYHVGPFINSLASWSLDYHSSRKIKNLLMSLLKIFNR